MLDWGFVIDYEAVFWLRFFSCFFWLLHWKTKMWFFFLSDLTLSNLWVLSCCAVLWMLLPAPSEHLEWVHLSECDLAVGCCRWAGSWNKIFLCLLLPTWAVFWKKQGNTPHSRLFREEQDEGPKLLGRLSSGIKGIIWEAAKAAIGWADATKRVMC